MTIFSKNLGGMAPLAPLGCDYALTPPRKFSAYATEPSLTFNKSGSSAVESS